MNKFVINFLILVFLLVTFPTNTKAQSTGGSTLGTSTCDAGLRRCNRLRDNIVHYWGCMEETCNNQEISSKDASCDEGHKECVSRLSEYRLCMNLICKNPLDSYQECDHGKRSCAASLTQYWDCVSEICIGDIEEFTKAAKDTTADYINQLYRNKNNIGILGVHPQFRYPPKGVDSRSWSSFTPPSRTLKGPPISQVKCKSDSAQISCVSNDIRSCRCADGSLPTFKK